MSVRLEEVTKEFSDSSGRIVRAVDGVSLDIAKGELVTLLGPSGCGKTTTLRMIAGFERPTRGAIWIGGKAVTDAPAHRRGTPMVFQSYALFPHLTVRENAGFGLATRGIEKRAAIARVERMAESMGLRELLDRSPHQLSGGQQQRVALLRALVTEPEVLLFDEPLSNLDARLRVAMRIEIRRIQKRSGITAVYVTHDQDEAMVLSDRIVVMDRGRVAQIGPPREIYMRPANRFVAGFLGDANFLDASVAGRNGPRVEVECALGRFTVEPGQASGAGAGQRVTLVVRPEAVSIAELGPMVPGAATVKSVAYLGADALYEVVRDRVLLLSRAQLSGAAAVLSEGTRVSISLDPAGIHVLAE